MRAISCSEAILADTIRRLRTGGERGEERGVLWLVRSPSGVPARVCEVFEPEQVAAEDRFRLPPESVQALMAHLRRHRLKVAAQVHTHPEEAFHSEADDEWAIVRHRGALSLVLPRFASTTEPGNFLEEALTYELSGRDRWEEVSPTDDGGSRIEVER